MEAIVDKGNLSHEQMVQEMIERDKQGFTYGEITIWLKAMAAKYGVSFYKTRFTYYQYVREKDTKRLVPDKTVEIAPESEKESESMLANLANHTVEKSIPPQVDETQVGVQQEAELDVPAELKPSKKDAEAKKSIRPTDENINEFIVATPASSQLVQTSTSRPNKPPYRYGDEVEAEVMRIVSYGAFLEITDGYNYSGLLHVSEIRNLFIENISDYLTEGDIIKARIKLAQENKIQFSTKDYGVIKKVRSAKEVDTDTLSSLPPQPKNTLLKDKLEQVKDKLQFSEPVKSTEVKSTETDTIAIAALSEQTGGLDMQNTQATTPQGVMHKKTTIVQFGSNNKANTTSTQINTEETQMNGTSTQINTAEQIEEVLNWENDIDIKRMVEVLNNKIGAVSPAAIRMLIELKKEFGAFMLAPTFFEVYEEFEVDLGVQFASRLQKKVGGCL